MTDRKTTCEPPPKISAELKRLLGEACAAGRAALGHESGADKECEELLARIESYLSMPGVFGSCEFKSLVEKACRAGRRSLANRGGQNKTLRLIGQIEAALCIKPGLWFRPGPYNLARGSGRERLSWPYEFDPGSLVADPYKPLLAPYEEKVA